MSSILYALLFTLTLCLSGLSCALALFWGLHTLGLRACDLWSASDGGTFFPQGLTNLHNTCFLNAALQALAGIPSFVSALHAGLPAEPGVGGTGLGTFQAAFQGKRTESLTGSGKTPVSAAGPAAGVALVSECSANSLKREGCANDVAERLQRRRQRQRILRRLQQQRQREQPDCLAHLDESQRRHLLRELFNVLSRLTWAGVRVYFQGLASKF